MTVGVTVGVGDTVLVGVAVGITSLVGSGVAVSITGLSVGSTVVVGVVSSTDGWFAQLMPVTLSITNIHSKHNFLIIVILSPLNTSLRISLTYSLFPTNTTKRT